MVGRPRGGKNRYWPKEEKIRIIRRVTENYESTISVSNSEKISNGLLNNWLKRYYELGENGLNNNRKKPCLLKHYSSSKNLSNIEQLEYENLKLRIENERLKKGYLVEGDGQNKKYISLKNKNLK